MITNAYLKDPDSVHVQCQPDVGTPPTRPKIWLDKYDQTTNTWLCQGCYMDGTDTNGGDCVVGQLM